MLLFGSRALVANNPELEGVRKCVDWDFICTLDQFKEWHKRNRANLQFAVPTQQGKYYHARDKDGMNYEFELAWPGTSAEMLLNWYDMAHESVSTPAVAVCNTDLLLIKLSHRYKRNSPHHLKTMKDIKFLRSVTGHGEGSNWMEGDILEFFKLRESESYTYSHPKLDVSNGEFFSGDGVQYKYDHDDLHRVVAIDGAPAYTHYLKDGSAVLTSNEKFFSVDQRIRLLGALEESMVLAAERSLIPYDFQATPEQAFTMALNKVTSSITSGKFREFCWEHYDEIVAMYWELDGGAYAEKVRQAIEKGELKPYENDQIGYS